MRFNIFRLPTKGFPSTEKDFFKETYWNLRQVHYEFPNKMTLLRCDITVAFVIDFSELDFQGSFRVQLRYEIKLFSILIEHAPRIKGNITPHIS
jgi:hypothetical protein